MSANDGGADGNCQAERQDACVLKSMQGRIPGDTPEQSHARACSAESEVKALAPAPRESNHCQQNESYCGVDSNHRNTPRWMRTMHGKRSHLPHARQHCDTQEHVRMDEGNNCPLAVGEDGKRIHTLSPVYRENANRTASLLLRAALFSYRAGSAF